MAQERFWNWKDDDLTFRLNWRELGIHGAGRYRGFEFVSAAGMSLQLAHTSTGVVKTKLDNSLSNPMGLWLSKHGVIVTEDATVTIGTVSNGDATHPRIDLIVARHQYVQTIGGANATYSIVQGTPSASPALPALPFPNQQVILGKLYVPANATNLNDVGVVYTPAKVPYFAETQLFLEDNADVTVNNAQAGQTIIHDGTDFKNTNVKDYIQTLNIKMSNAFEQATVVYPNTGAIPVVTSGGAAMFNGITANTYLFDFTTGGSPFLLAGLPNAYQLGAEIYFIVKAGDAIAIKLAHGTTGANHLPIVSYNYNSYYVGNQNAGYYTLHAAYTKYKFTRMANFWLMTEEQPIRNTLPALAWLLVYFPDIVRGAGATGFTCGGLGTVGNSGLLGVTATNIMRTANDAGYRVDFPVPLPSTVSGLGYIVQTTMYSTGTTTTEGDYANDISPPMIQNSDLNGFEVYFREVANVVQTDIYIDFIIIPRVFTDKPI